MGSWLSSAYEQLVAIFNEPSRRILKKKTASTRQRVHVTESHSASLNLKSASKFGTGPIWGSVLAVFGVVLEFFNLLSH